jgi:uncharacterized membrane protein YidH (DUF202 family)
MTNQSHVMTTLLSIVACMSFVKLSLDVIKRFQSSSVSKEQDESTIDHSENGLLFIVLVALAFISVGAVSFISARRMMRAESTTEFDSL